ncbi:hemolysin family protein [Nesterenkonia lutea]|uniref:CBS domain containing-hemolysin-like protein n=1 Tax=Nesterenkonia lutea TaxID=272919 RepID=A0ABR9JDS6_9MICC|nr:hemolysin family protein [Nesterenkonia lutea]MBE1524073.1 CBS domain containing-hemolysin-like protein [Nesterenkonia lutea]
MTLGLLILLALASGSLAFTLSAADSAFLRLSRREAEEIVDQRRSTAVAMILAHPAAHTLALRMWRWFFTTALVVLVVLASILALGGLAAGAVLGCALLLVGGLVTAAVSPRQIGRGHHQLVAAATARLVRALRVALGPLPVALSRLGSRTVPGGSESDRGFFDDEEFREFVTRASETDIIEDAEAELLQSVFDLSTTRVRAVMVPRTDMVTVEAGTSVVEVMTLFLRSGYSRVPVVRGSADDITGMVYLKDAAFLHHRLRSSEAPSAYAGRDPDSILVDEIQRDVRYVPESKPVSEFLSELQRESTHVAIVVDEYGGTAGMVTLEDLIEEIVGEIVDEYDTEAAEIEEISHGRRRLSARMSVDDFAELYELDLDDEEEVDTVGGLLAKALGRVAIAGSEVEIPRRSGPGVVLRADRLEGRRNRVSHVLAWEAEQSRGARAGLGTQDEPEGLHLRAAESASGHDRQAATAAPAQERIGTPR